MGTANSSLMGKRPSVNNRTDFGKHLVELRLAAGLTQSQIADALGKTQAQYSAWEKTGRLPGRDTIPKMAELLGVTIEDLLRTNRSNGLHRGPKGELERLIDDARTLPKHKKKQLAEVLQALIEKAKK